MQKKINSLWLYAIILLGVALTLILISALAQVNLSPNESPNLSELDKQLLANQTAQQTSAALAEENEKLKDNYARLESQRDELVVTYELLLTASYLFDEENFDESFSTLENIDATLLPESAGYAYLIQKLEQKGYVFDD